MLKETKINSGAVYIGKNAGAKILDAIKSASGSIQVMTPYISTEFIDLLADKANRGVDVSLIVSSDIGGKDRRASVLRKLVRQIQHTDAKAKEKRGKALVLIALVSAVLGISAFAGMFYDLQGSLYILAPMPILLLAWVHYHSVRIYTYTYSPVFDLAVTLSPYTHQSDKSHYLTHAKMYIIDGKIAYLGSINFTKASFWRNYELRVGVNDIQAIQKLKKEFDYMRDNRNTRYLDIGAIGAEIYEEPLN